MATSNHPLGELIGQVRATNGWSLEDVCARARRQGHTISPQNISRLSSEPVVTMKASTVRALACGLGVPPEAVVSAALKSMGFPVDKPAPSTEDAIGSDPRLSERDRRVLLAALAQFVTSAEDA